MPKLLELIEKKAVPENVMQSAASGELPMPPEEAIEVLVRLTRDEKFGAQARETLKRWDAKSITTALAHPGVRRETAKWVLSPENPYVIQVVTQLAKGSVDPKGLEAVLAVCPGQVIPAFLTLPRFRESEPLLQKLLENPELPEHQATLVRSHLSQLRGEAKLQA